MASGRPIRAKGRQTVPARDRIRLELPGGGGYGDPHDREAARVVSDVHDGLISVEAAGRDYGVIIRDGETDAGATAAARRCVKQKAR
jgi:N-methylhydantoinase B